MDAHTILAASPAFAGLNAKALNLLADAADKRLLRPGHVLFNAGDHAESFHVIGTGRLLLLRPEDTGFTLLRELVRGEVVGGVSMMTGERRLTRVEVLRESVVVTISKRAFDVIAAKHPHEAIEIIRFLVGRLVRTINSPGEAPTAQSLATIALVPGHPGMDLVRVANAMAAAMSQQGATLRLNADRVDRALGQGAANSMLDDTERSEQVAAWLSELETQYRYLIYATDGDDSPWSRRCIRQADRVLVVVDGAASARATPEIRAFQSIRGRTTAELCIVHYTGEKTRAQPHDWNALCQTDSVLHATLDQPESMERLVRLLTGRGLGLVLGGGGARGFAHLGLWQALGSLGIEFDVLGGASMGAYVAALMAMGHDCDEAKRNLRETFVDHNYLNDYVVPRVAMISGKKFLRRLDEVFGSRRIEDLHIPYFSVSTNLSQGESVAHREGVLRDWIAASMAVPGIVPPLVWRGDLLCDGGVLNSLPVDKMRELGRGPIVSCDVSNRERFMIPQEADDRPEPLRWQRGVERFPGIGRLLHRAATVVSSETIARRETDAECYIHMPVSGVGMFDWDRMDEIIQASYDYAMPRLEAFLESEEGRLTQQRAAGRHAVPAPEA